MNQYTYYGHNTRAGKHDINYTKEDPKLVKLYQSKGTNGDAMFPDLINEPSQGT